MFRKVIAAIAGVVFLFFAGHVAAADIPLPPVNLGDTSFQDGVAFPGWLVEESLGYYHAGLFKDHLGDNIPGTNRLTTLSATTHIAYISTLRMLGCYYGAEILLPVADVNVHTGFGPRDREQE